MWSPICGPERFRHRVAQRGALALGRTGPHHQQSRRIDFQGRRPRASLGVAVRHGTHKLFLHPPTRYSEDIDLVQTTAEPIGETFDALKAILDP